MYASVIINLVFPNILTTAPTRKKYKQWLGKEESRCHEGVGCVGIFDKGYGNVAHLSLYIDEEWEGWCVSCQGRCLEQPH